MYTYTEKSVQSSVLFFLYSTMDNEKTERICY